MNRAVGHDFIPWVSKNINLQKIKLKMKTVTDKILILYFSTFYPSFLESNLEPTLLILITVLVELK